MTYLGAPMVYYGDEVGMWGATDPCCRKPMIWDDFKYDDEVYLPDGSKRAIPDRVSVNKNLFNHYKKLIDIRNSHKSLQFGDFKSFLVDNKNELYGFSRAYKGEYIMVILNNSQKEKKVKITVDVPGKFTDLLNGGNTVTVKNDRILSFSIKPQWGKILLLKNK